jgi:hypothetical protein
MARRLSVLLLLAVIFHAGASTTASADASGASRVALIDTSTLWSEGGIATYAAANAKLDAEEPNFKVVELPPGAQLPKKTGFESIDEMNRGNVRWEAWMAHKAKVLDPIKADVMRALERYMRARGIGLVLDRLQIQDAVFIALPGVDITDAFIKDYNATTAKTLPKAPPKK